MTRFPGVVDLRISIFILLFCLVTDQVIFSDLDAFAGAGQI